MSFNGSRSSGMNANIAMFYPSASLEPEYGSYKHSNFVTGVIKQTQIAISGVTAVQEPGRLFLGTADIITISHVTC